MNNSMKSTFINITNHYITSKTKVNKSFDEGQLKTKNNNYFIVNHGAAPIYSRYGDIHKLTEFVGVYIGIISKLNAAFGKNDEVQ